MTRLALLAVAAVLALPATASADVLLPPEGKVYTGVTGSQSVGPFARQVGKHPSVFGFFTRWNGPVEYIYESVERAESRLMLHISTQDGYGTPEAFSPREIAQGEGDAYLIRTNRRIAEYGRPTYVRFLAEMNQANNGYAAFNHNGRNIRANRARAYWPGAKYVDWVGTDFYSKFPNFTDLETFYDDFPGKPFVFGEWALWDGDDPGFVRRFFRWVNSHKRVRMLLYNQGNTPGEPFRLSGYPESRKAIKQELRRKRFLGEP